MTKKIEVGTEIYYRGDMANQAGKGEVVRIVNDRWGTHADFKMEDGREIKGIALHMIHHKDEGHGGTRFVTWVAYQEYRRECLAIMSAAMTKAPTQTIQ